MDGGPFRGSRQVDRRAVVTDPRRPGPSPQKVAVSEEPKASTARSAAPTSAKDDKKSSKKFVWPVVVALLILALVGWMWWSNNRGVNSTIDPDKYQAVFFDDGQVYFGKLKYIDADNMKLTNVFYLKSPTGEDGAVNPEDSSSNDSSVQLIKLGKEIHGPEDSMTINRDQVKFFENLKSDSQVSKLMKDYKD